MKFVRPQIRRLTSSNLIDSGRTEVRDLTRSRDTLDCPKDSFILVTSGRVLNNNGDSAKKAEVTLRLEGQPQVKWVRTSSGTQYHIGTETNEKCGKNDLWDFLPQYPIQKEPDGRIFNFHTEFDVLFPFGFSSQELFKIFERVVSLEDTASVLKSMNDELTFLTAQCDREYMWSKNARVLVEEENAALRSIAAATSTFSNTDATKTAELLLQEEVQRFRSLFENVDKLQDLSSSLTPLNDDLSSWFPVLKIIQINDQGVYRDGGLGEGGFSPEDRSGTPVDDARDATPSHANCTHACIEEGVVNVTHTAHTNSSTKETKPNQVRTTPQTRITATYLPYDARKHDNSLIETANALVERSAGVGTRMKMAEESLKALKDHTALSTRLTALSGLPECPTLDTEALERVQSLYGALERFRLKMNKKPM